MKVDRCGDQVQFYFIEGLILQSRPKILLIPFYMGFLGRCFGEERQ